MAVMQLVKVSFLVVTSILLLGGSIKPAYGTAYSSEDQQTILEAHNYYRSIVLPTAVNMNEMEWDADLANKAQEWADFCIYEHPDKTIYKDYVGIGQNLYASYNSNGNITPEPTLTAALESWYNENQYYDYEDSSCATGKVCGHYTQMVWADNTAVGCGINYCETAKQGDGFLPNAWIVVCNYKPGGNFIGQAPYETDLDAVQCSKCSDGKACKNGLCSYCIPNGEDCECKIKCENCASPNLSDTCECSCVDGYYGAFCEEYCEEKDAYCGANPGWPKSWCGDNSRPYVDENCPVMCELCTEGPEVDANNCL